MNNNENSNEMKNIVEFEKTANDIKKEVKQLYFYSCKIFFALIIIFFIGSLFYSLGGYLNDNNQALTNGLRMLTIAIVFIIFAISYCFVLIKIYLTKFMRGNINGVKKYTLACREKLYTLNDLTVGNVLNFNTNEIKTVVKRKDTIILVLKGPEYILLPNTVQILNLFKAFL
jgi:heme/copper-type cytochrome/quinol oxidase subunit 2